MKRCVIKVIILVCITGLMYAESNINRAGAVLRYNKTIQIGYQYCFESGCPGTNYYFNEFGCDGRLLSMLKRSISASNALLGYEFDVVLGNTFFFSSVAAAVVALSVRPLQGTLKIDDNAVSTIGVVSYASFFAFLVASLPFYLSHMEKLHKAIYEFNKYIMVTPEVTINTSDNRYIFCLNIRY